MSVTYGFNITLDGGELDVESKGFIQVQSNKRLIATLFSHEPALANDLLVVTSTFNPVREFFRPTP